MKNSILLLLFIILVSCSESQNNYYEMLQGDWSNEEGFVLSIRDSLFDGGDITFKYNTLQIVEDTLILERAKYQIVNVTEKTLRLKPINIHTERDFMILKRTDRFYTDNIDLIEFEVRPCPGGCFILSHFMFLIRNDSLFMKVEGRAKKDPDWPAWPRIRGVYTAKLTPKLYKEIVDKFRSIEWGKLENNYSSVFDNHKIKVKLRRKDNNKEYYIESYGGHFLPELDLLIGAVYKLNYLVDLKKVKDEKKYNFPQLYRPIPINEPN